jgi:hypothetical protein
MRRSIHLTICSAIVAAVAMAAPWVALAAPDNARTITYSFHDCAGMPGAPAVFDAVKQPSGAAAMHVLGSNAVFIVVAAEDVETGDVLFSVPGFAHNGLPTLTCTSTHPVTGEAALITGRLVAST